MTMLRHTVVVLAMFSTLAAAEFNANATTALVDVLQTKLATAAAAAESAVAFKKSKTFVFYTNATNVTLFPADQTTPAIGHKTFVYGLVYPTAELRQSIGQFQDTVVTLSVQGDDVRDQNFGTYQFGPGYGGLGAALPKVLPAGADALNLAGEAPPYPASKTLALAGGTGRFFGATGECSITYDAGVGKYVCRLA